MQPTAHTFEIAYHEGSPVTVDAHNVTEVGDWMHFTGSDGQMLFMAQKIAVKSIRRHGPVDPAEPELAGDVAA